MNTQAEKQALYGSQASCHQTQNTDLDSLQCSACTPLTRGTAEKYGLQTSEEDAKLKMCTKPADVTTSQPNCVAGSGQPPMPIMSSPAGILPALQPQG